MKLFSVCITSVLILTHFMVPVARAQVGVEVPVDERLGQVGIAVKTTEPEGSILAVALPNVYILPDSPLYIMVKFWESLNFLFADTPEEKSDLLFTFAEKRLAETVKLLEKDSGDLAINNIDRYKNQLDQAINTVQLLDDSEMREKKYTQVQEQVWYQRALSKIISAEGLSELLLETSMALETDADKGRLELESIE